MRTRPKTAYVGKTGNFRVRRYTSYAPDGQPADIEDVERPDCVCIFALRGSRLLLPTQYRHSIQKVLLEIPAGTIDAGETPLQAAKRELKEETGYSARKWRRAMSFYSSPGCHTELMHMFVATQLKAGKSATEQRSTSCRPRGGWA